VAAKGITLPIIFKSDDSGLKQAGSSLEGFGKKLAGLAAIVAGAFSIKAITSFAKESVLAAEAAQTAQNRLEAVAKATGVFGEQTKAVTDRLGEFAKAQEMRIAVDDKVIKGVQAQLLTFKALSSTADEQGGIFDRTTMAAFDMAAVFGSADSAAMGLAKALEDPTRGMGALRKQGVMFSDEQAEQIKLLQQSGDLLGAQEIILSEVESQFGGVAEATADASVKMGLAFENIKETAGAVLLPVFADLVEGMIPVTEMIGQEVAAAFEELTPVLTEIVKEIPNLVKAFMPVIPILGQVASIFFELVQRILPIFVRLLDIMLPAIEELAPIVADALVVAFDALAPVLMELIELLMPIVSALLPVISKLIQALAPIIVKVVSAFMPLLNMVLPLLIKLIEFLAPILVVIGEILAIVLVKSVEILTNAFKGFMTFLKPFTEMFEQKFGGIKDFFYNIVNGMIGFFEAFVNAVISGFNFLIRALNRLSFKAPDWLEGPLKGKTIGFNLAEISKVQFPRVALAQGGIVTRPTNALIGEAGPEAVIPLDRMPMGNTYNITINANVADARLGEVVVNAIKRYERSSGPVFASA
jgi:phage-related protein